MSLKNKKENIQEFIDILNNVIKTIDNGNYDIKLINDINNIIAPFLLDYNYNEIYKDQESDIDLDKISDQDLEQESDIEQESEQDQESDLDKVSDLDIEQDQESYLDYLYYSKFPKQLEELKKFTNNIINY
jgi:hypothetical protein